jgi:hypothetical protein
VKGKISRDGMPDIRTGKVEKATNSYADLMERDMASAMNAACYNGALLERLYKYQREDARSKWKDYISKHPEANKPDSIASVMFRYQNWLYFGTSFSLQTDFNSSYRYNDGYDQLKRIARFANIMIQEFEQDVDLVIVAGKNSFARDHVFKISDLSLMVRTNASGTAPQYFSFDDNFDCPNMIPYSLQGEKAKIFPFDKKHQLLIVRNQRK